PGPVSGAQERSCHLSATHVCHPSGTRSLGTAATRVAPVSREAWADQGRSAALLAWPKRVPLCRGGVQRWAGRAGGTALCRRAFESIGAATSPDVCHRARAGSRRARRPHAACPCTVVCV